MKYKLTQDEFDTLASEYVGIDDTEVRSDYSGRGMWGDECLAYAGPEPHLFVHDLAVILAKRISHSLDDEDVRDQLTNIGPWLTDSLGRNTVYYWPQVEVEVDMSLLTGDAS